MEYIKQDLKSVINVKQIVTIHYFELTKSTNYPVDIHDFWEIHYVDKGTAISYAEDERHVLGRGDLLFHKPNARHQLMASGENAPNVCVISFVCHSPQMKRFEGQRFHLNAEQTALLRKFFDEAHVTFEISHTTPDLKKLIKKPTMPIGGLQMLRLRLEELFLLLLRDLDAQPARLQSFLFTEEYPDELVNAMIRYMQQHITEKLSIPELCKVFSYGKTFLCGRFLTVTGKTINRFFVEMKIDAAKRMIRSRDENVRQISRISDMLNFSTPAYFYSTFKKVTGMTPSEYATSIRHYNTDEKHTNKKTPS